MFNSFTIVCVCECVCDSFPGCFLVFQPFQAQNPKSNNYCIKCLCFNSFCSFSWAFKGLGKWVENCQDCSRFGLFVNVNKLVCMK